MDPKTSDNSPHPITAEEVAKAKVRWRKSAPGPDGVTTEQVRSKPDRQLALLFTVLLYSNTQLARFKKSRTTLIYKKGIRTDPANWRPITVASMLLRLFHRVLADRLRQQTQLNPNQRGFIQQDGTMANVLILETFLKSRAAALSTTSIVGIDVTKAFDSVSHHSIERGLNRMRIEQHLKEYIVSSLRDNHTTIRLGEHNTRQITFNRGVKQGDPISPMLFNIVLDEYIQLSNAGNHGGTMVNSVKVATLAFADDIILMEDSPDQMVASLERARRFLSERGMEINPQKCFSATTMRHRGAIKAVTRSTYAINGQHIQAVTDVNPAKS